MEKQDLVLTCKECGNEFTITVSEQEFYESKGLALPKRCHDCRKARKANNGNNDEWSKPATKKSLEDMMKEAGLLDNQR